MNYMDRTLRTPKATATTDGYLTKEDWSLFATGAGAAVWGGITGTLSNQTDLQSALNAKYDASNPSGFITGASPTFTGTATFTGTFGYGTGAGGTVTQITSKSTGVTLNKICGQITTSNSAIGNGGVVSFILTNSTIAATDVMIVNVGSGGTAGAYLVSVGFVTNGSCSITIFNASAGFLSEALVLNYAIIKSVIV